MYKLGKINVGGKNPVRIMGILNTSPESFYKKSIKTSKISIRNTIKQMELDGADFIDVGGMSTAPYFKTIVSSGTELERIRNAITIIQNSSNLPISIDTCRAEIAKFALDEGVEIINDISGLKYDLNMPKLISKYHPSLILCAYDSKIVQGTITSTKNLLNQSLKIAMNHHVSKYRITLDPSIGFFRKTGIGPFFTKIKSNWFERDLSIISNLKKIKKQNPILISVSNKSFIGKLLRDKNPNNRLFGSLAVETIAVLNGADIIRTHNVKETKDAVKIASQFIHRHKGL